MSLIRFILWSLLFYLVIKTVSNIYKFFVSEGTENKKVPKPNSKKSKYNIDTKDVIEAHFEELGSEESEKSKHNS
jgi:hypothetical protein